MIKSQLALHILLIFVSNTYADSTTTAYKLLLTCIDIDSTECVRFIEQAESSSSDEVGSFCYPEDITLRDKNSSIIKYIDKHTSMLQSDAFTAIRVAASELYPCE